MTTIKSMYGKDLDIWPDPDFPGWVGIRCKDDGSRLYKMVDLANALGLEPKRVHPRASGPTLVESHIEKLRAELKETRAKLGEAEATIARVEAALDHPAVRNGTEGADYHVRKALHPEPEFVLPTEVPATIEAVAAHGEVERLILWTDGKTLTWWTEDDSDEYTPERVMREFKDHRLIGAES